LDNTTIAEDDPPDSLVGIFSTTDPNAGDTHTYSLVAGTGDTDNGRFKIGGVDGDELLTNTAFSITADTTYLVRVRSTDAGGLYVEDVFQILVTNVTGQAATQSTATPTVTATAEPTVEPTSEPTAEPTATPTASPTAEPTLTPTVEPTATP
jgi:hypothetical protein